MTLFSREGEEVMKSRVLLLQLMQNCFPVLPNPLEPQSTEESVRPDEGASAATLSASSSEEPPGPSAGAVLELYTHLCQSRSSKNYM